MNRLVKVVDIDGTVTAEIKYDKHGNVIEVTDINAGKLPSGERAAILYTYDRLNNVTSERRPVDFYYDKEEKLHVNYRLTKYEYDIEGNLIKETHYLEPQTKTSAIGRVRIIQSLYDKSERLIQVKDSTGALIRYEYDTLNRRIAIKSKINDKVYSSNKIQI